MNNIFGQFEDNANNVAYAIGVMVYFVITEYIPDFFALDYTFMMTYIKRDSEGLSIDEGVQNV
jgi:hypothetical protein